MRNIILLEAGEIVLFVLMVISLSAGAVLAAHGLGREVGHLGVSFWPVKNELRRGFTLIEVVVVILIMAMLAALAVGAIVAARNAAKEATHRSNGKSLQAGMEAYYSKNTSYPASSGTVSFTAAATSLGVTLAPTPECTGTALGGGTVLYASATPSYTITAYNAACTGTMTGSNNVYLGP